MRRLTVTFAVFCVMMSVALPAAAQRSCASLESDTAAAFQRIDGFRQRNPQAFAVFSQCMQDNGNNTNLCAGIVCFTGGMNNDWTCADFMSSISTSMDNVVRYGRLYREAGCGTRDEMITRARRLIE